MSIEQLLLPGLVVSIPHISPCILALQYPDGICEEQLSSHFHHGERNGKGVERTGQPDGAEDEERER